jgi:hypothetical protein
MWTSSAWEAEIAGVSELSDFQNATITVTDPSALTKVYDYETNEYTVTGDGLVYSGQARVQPQRGAADYQFMVANPSASKSIIVQIPSVNIDFIRRGFQVQVTDGGRNPNLEQYLFTVVADVNSSHMASHTFECVVDVEQNPNWGN